MDKRAPLIPPVRSEFEHSAIAAGNIGEVQRPLSAWERVTNIGFVRKAFILVVIASVWELYARFPIAWKFKLGGVERLIILALAAMLTMALCRVLMRALPAAAAAAIAVALWCGSGIALHALGLVVIEQEEPLLLPRFSAAIAALVDACFTGPPLEMGLDGFTVAPPFLPWLGVSVPAFSFKACVLGLCLPGGPLLYRIGTTLQVLFVGYALGLVLAGLFTSIAITTRFGRDLLETLTAMFNPLPAIALLPLALLWFGLSQKSLWFVIVHSVLWAVALNAHTGFMSVSETLRMAGQNYGLKGMNYVFRLLIPAAFPSILSGLKIGWAFAWRTLIASELVFGVSSRSGGLGWFIFENRNQLETAYVFAGLLTVIIIGLLVENVVFKVIERRTVQRWGMQR